MKLRMIILVLLGALLAITMLGRASSVNDVYLPLVMNGSDGDEELPTSIELIEADLAAGILDAKTAAIYEVYTVLPNSPLPSKYVGAADPKADIAAFSRLWNVYDSLSPEQKAAVDPYLRRPDEPSSAYYKFQQERALQHQDAALSAGESRPLTTRPPETILWDSINTVTGVKIHYRVDITGDDITAAGLAAAIDGKIFKSLNDLMGHVWLDDMGCDGGGIADNGGDGALDIYLLHGMGVYGEAVRCLDEPPSPTWITLNADRLLGDETHAGMVQDATHEMFHAIQNSYVFQQVVSTYSWMREATAMWAEDYVYPQAQSEWPYAKLYLHSTQESMDIVPNGSYRHYGEYLWPFYMYRVKQRNPNFIRTMFESAASYPSTDIFMLSTGSDDPVSLFPEFAVMNWNQAPFDNYKKVDSGMAERVNVQYRTVVSGLNLPTKNSYLLSGSSGGIYYEHLTAMYYDFVFTDNTARTVAFYNGIDYKLSEDTGCFIGVDPTSTCYQTSDIDLSAHRGMNVQALIKINGTWTLEDWTNYSKQIYCRDRKSQRIQELVLIITNSNFKKSQPNFTFSTYDKIPVLEVSPTACYQWKGTFDVTDTSDPDVTHTLTGNVTFEAPSSLYGPNVFFKMKSGNAYLTLQGTTSDGNTVYNIAGWTDFTTSDPSSYVNTYNLVTGGPHPNAYEGYGYSNSKVDGTYDSCCDEDGHWENGLPISWPIGQWLKTPSLTSWLTQANGDVIQGSYTDAAHHIVYSWDLRAVVEP